ncbi:hypothetical protein D0T50_01710 [Bacteroides sp. 214]|uniref:NigD-like protein n=1 Tax=Bacteroides sp. 214 TaxID=2302935 RepID=UPI0013D4335F|nr:NigD-like protein [Bacteroides sp. 214]NDW11602.1 hypothetical protein [Bacteroides sp. 214]
MMKQIKNLSLFIAILLSAAMFSACDEDFLKSDEPTGLAIGYIELIDDGYFFQLDNGKKMYPGDVSLMPNYKPEEGKRVIVYFQSLSQKIAGYDYNIKVIHIESILTKEIISLTADNVEEIGEDRVNITGLWIANGCLTIEFQMEGTRNPAKKHFINLVKNELEEPEQQKEGYLSLELRHNAYDDPAHEILNGLVSFTLPESGELPQNGFIIKAESIYEGAKYYKVELPESSLDAISLRHYMPEIVQVR